MQLIKHKKFHVVDRICNIFMKESCHLHDDVIECNIFGMGIVFSRGFRTVEFKSLCSLQTKDK